MLGEKSKASGEAILRKAGMAALVVLISATAGVFSRKAFLVSLSQGALRN